MGRRATTTAISTAISAGTIAGAALAVTLVGGVLPAASPRGLAATVLPLGTAEALPAATGCEALRRWYVRAALPAVGPWGLSGPPVLVPAGAASRRAVGTSPTGGNVQEAGVDEADVAKTDGRLLVRVVGRTMVVTDVRHDRTSDLSRTTLPGDWVAGAELLLRGTEVLVVTAGPSLVRPLVGGPEGRHPLPVPSGGAARTRLISYDLSDPAAPRLTDDRTLDGRLVSSRLHADGTVRIGVSSPLPRIAFVHPGGGRTLARATAENRRRLRAAPLTAWLPQVQAAGVRSPLVACGSVRHPLRPSGFGTLSVVGFPIGRPDRADTVSVVTGGDLLHSSAHRLYVATVAGERTTVHAFALDGPRTSYVGSGGVPGVVADRWSLSEGRGLLRVASTSAPERRQPSVTVTVLEERGGALVPTGSLSGIGRGEQLTAVRWLGSLAVLVTYRVTDPLWTVDLSDPARPRLLGRLRAPGFSSYLHPVGGGLLVGLGQAAGTTDGSDGQAATFDVTDPRAVRRVGSLSLGAGTSVDAGSDGRAASYLPEQRTLVAAVTSWATGGSRFVALHVAADGRLTRTGSWPDRGAGYDLRALPLGGDRVVLVGAGIRVVHVG